MSPPEQITVIGAGLMGHGIAQIFACHGHPVWLVDNDKDFLDSAKDRIATNLTKMSDGGIEFPLNLNQTLDQIRTTQDLTQACEGCDIAIEAVFEDLMLKQQLFVELDQLCPPKSILCSNTSVISITEIAVGAKHRERILGTHFWNPPYLVPLVEVIRTPETADWCAEAIFELLQCIGNHPVHVHKDVPGFVGNRLQHALWREAFAIIDEEICDPATVDEVIRNGFGLRLPILGPVETADMVGLDLTLAIHNYILKHINADPTPSTTLQERVEAGELGFKSGNGFQRWSKNDIAKSRERLADYLIAALAKRRKEV
jgi:3-hydroxybutyryl-CoA dehydrogenase